MDGDPVTGSQGVTAMTLNSFGPVRTEGFVTIIIVANQSVRIEDQTRPQAVTFTLKRESDVMRIDDIADPNMPSIRSYFKKNYGQ